MTACPSDARLLGRQDVYPATCTVCARRSHGLAYGTKLGEPVWWICDFCVYTSAQKVSEMNTLKLNQFEIMAIEHAAKETIDDILPAIFEKLWGQGIRNLEDMNGSNYPAILAEVASSPDYKAAIQKVLIEYSNRIRKDIQTQAVPF
ncbi:MAG: hypothetical protein ACOZAM_15150 [Pseudomonadota bacterium]